jgi:microcin C transport system substrate-binding protein|tara:strand:+ start:1568 stop:3337 length:1770 start_codon:yes stop_codon:yes gene_type:complete
MSFAEQPQHGLSLFGNLKYSHNFTHFDYVNPQAPKGGQVRYATVGSFDSLNPFILKGVPAVGSGLPFESLLVSASDEPDSAYGLIAEKVFQAKDNSWVKFTINKNARWHDGSRITADDVVFSFQTLIDKGHPNFSIMLKGVSEVVSNADLEITYYISDVENRKLPLIIGGLPILQKEYFSKNPFDTTTLVTPMGSGPYKISDLDPGRSITFERVQNYWGKDLPVNVGRYNFDKIIYDYYRDRDVMVEALKAGEYDIHQEYTSKTWATAYDIKAVQDGWLIKDVLEDNTPSGVQAFFINTRRDKFKNLKLREALSYAFDYEWTNKNIFFGLYKRMASYFENSDLASNGLPEGRELKLLEKFRGQIPNEVFTQKFIPPKTDGSGNIRKNLRIAASLLADSGWTLIDGDRVHNQTGHRLEIEFLYFERTFERILAPYARNLEKLGITTSLRLVDVTQYIKRLEEHDFDITTRRFVQGLSPGAELLSYFGSETADQFGTLNASGIKDPVVDALLLEVLSAKDREQLTVATRALDRILLWGHYMVPQWYKGTHHIVYWNFFDRPVVKPKYAIGFDTWWWNEEKVRSFKNYKSGG